MGRNRYVGKWTEPVSEKIVLPFTVESARQVLGWGAFDEGSRPYSHRDIAHWSSRFCETYRDVDTEESLTRVLRVLEDVDAQWEMYLFNTYAFDELPRIDLDTVRLPTSWFARWAGEVGDGES